MKKLATCVFAVAALIGAPAFAAHMAVKAPPPPPAPVYNWTGFYVGGNVGYGWGNTNTDAAGNGSVNTCASIPGGRDALRLVAGEQLGR